VAAATLGPAQVVMRPAIGRCEDCHVDPHGGRFVAGGARPHPDGCLGCHGMEGFRPSTYALAEHASSRFPLAGAHRATPCAGCHEELKAQPAAATRVGSRTRALGFEAAKRACVDCHRSPHGDQFAARRDRGACEGCHDTGAFVPASRFDHQRDSAYRLEGAHARAKCSACHTPERDAAGLRRVAYRPLSTRCRDCHLDADPGPLSGGAPLFGRTEPTLLAVHSTPEVPDVAVR
jgi:hypothetical protein